MRLSLFQNKQGFLRNVSILTFCNIVVILVNLFTNMYLARVLHPEGYGQYGLIIASTNILSTLSSLGIQQVAIRRISQSQQSSWIEFKLSMIARFIGYLVFSIPYILFSLFFTVDQHTFSIVIVLNVLALTIWNGIQNVAFGMQRMEYTGYINMGATTLILLIYLLFPCNVFNLYYAIVVLITVSFLKDYLYYHKCKSEKLFTKNNTNIIKSKDVCYIIKESFPFYMLAIFTLFSTDLPVVFLSKNSGVIEVAYYDSANKILKPTAIILQTIMAALFPNLSKEYVNNKEKFVDKINSMFRLLTIMGTIVCFYIALFRYEIVYLIFGEEYKNTGNVLLTQCWYIVFHAIFALFGNGLAAMKQDKMLMVLSFIYALVSSLIFWPASFHGATFLSYGVIMMCIINISYHFVIFGKLLPGFIHYKEALILFLMVLSTILISLLFVKETWNFFIRLGLAFCIGACFFYYRRILFSYLKMHNRYEKE